MFTFFAILFVGQAVHVAYEIDDASVQTFAVQNDVAGAREIVTRLAPLVSTAQGKPMLCIGAAEGSALVGPVFEQAVFDENVRRFMYAQPKYLLRAQAWRVSASDPKTLLRACEEVFPKWTPTK